MIKCANGHAIRIPVIVPGKTLPTITCWACVAGAK